MAWTPLPLRPLVFLDTETTGLEPANHEVIEFAAVKMDPQTFSVIDKIEFKIKPLHIETAQPKALEVNGYTPEKWTDAIDPETAAKRISEFCSESVIVGHNVSFDTGFLEVLLKQYKIEKRIDYHKVDTCALAYTQLVHLGLESVSLVNVCKFLGISNEGAHGAAKDVERTIAVYRKLVRATWWNRWCWKRKNRKS